MEKYPFASVADERYPLLRVATAEQRPAHSPKLEWLVESTGSGRETWVNYTQICRTAFVPRDSTDRDKWLSLERHLRAVEDTLWFGKPSCDVSSTHPISTCGGVLHYLGRPPLYSDTIVLRPLQDLVYLQNRGDDGQCEFLSEFSLQVSPAPSIRPYREPTPRPIPQGSTREEEIRTAAFVIAGGRSEWE